MNTKTSKGVLGVLILLATLGAPPSGWARDYTLVVQPVRTPQMTRQVFAPLADYLSQSTGEHITLITEQNFFIYWTKMKQGRAYDFILDAAHLTDFRAKRMNFTPLAKLPDVVSFSLVTGPDTLMFDASDLVGKRVATLGAPSLAAMRLRALFPNPMRQPVIVEVNNSQIAIEKLLAKDVTAAIIPSPLVREYPSLNTIQTTEQVPHMALSASPNVPPSLQAKVRRALMQASHTAQGREALRVIGIEAFAKVDPETYSGYGELLEGTWGY